ncbi:hypothetical protein [Aminobacter ciceronei]|uniref:Uncharacterized protein n=1 Tax=Aminobacter ciceronei TaxID=150723 RepID=A0ABR6C6N8_9HYPH|nr:hypothetical protein [Aminobacter ciceronei]MBA8906797.1 hypothetical protein [Aminobacter ciceronei]MBA9020576.1 hypothetical protein [Aminobacter ciceronei]
MSYRTTVQLIAAAVTACVMVALGFALDGFLGVVSSDFKNGLLTGVIVTGLIVFFALRYDQRSAADAANRRQQQGPRNSIDL